MILGVSRMTISPWMFSSTLLIIERPTLKVVLLLAMAVWGFARAYYFAFYVIQHYVDGSYKFAGLLSFARYALGRRRARQRTADGQ